MEKLGVELDEEKTKTAEKLSGRRCPKCGTLLSPEDAAIPKCPVDGTEPFEKLPGDPSDRFR